MNATDWHFTITSGGIALVIGGLVHTVYRLGRILQRMDSHIDQSNDIHDKIDRRITWLERRRLTRDDS